MSLHKINYIFIQKLKRFLKIISIPFSLFPVLSSIFIQFFIQSALTQSKYSTYVCLYEREREGRTEWDRQRGNSGRPGQSSRQLKGLGAGERHLRGHAELALSPSSLSVCLEKCYYFYYRVPERDRERIWACRGAECETAMSIPSQPTHDLSSCNDDLQ